MARITAPEWVNETWQALWSDLVLYENTVKMGIKELPKNTMGAERLRGELKAIREIKKRMLQLDKE